MVKESARKNMSSATGDEIRIESPLKDHRIVQNDVDIRIEKDVPISIPARFMPTLIAEGVIKKEGE